MALISGIDYFDSSCDDGEINSDEDTLECGNLKSKDPVSFAPPLLQRWTEIVREDCGFGFRDRLLWSAFQMEESSDMQLGEPS
jgi:hypothetical protein